MEEDESSHVVMRKRSFSDSSETREHLEPYIKQQPKRRKSIGNTSEGFSFVKTKREKKKEKGSPSDNRSSSSDKKDKTPTIKVHNKLRDPIWVAVYYFWRIGWGDAKQVGPVIEILPSQQARIPKPSIRTDRTRKLIMSLYQYELPPKLSSKAFNRLQIVGVDFDDEIYIEYDKEDEESVFFKGFNKLQHQQRITKRMISGPSKPKPERERGASPLRRSLRNFARSSSNLVIRENKLTPTREDEPPLIEDLKSELVTERTELCSLEQNFLTKRNFVTHRAVEKFLDMEEGSLDIELTPRIAFTGSGGGARAMLCTIGVLQGLTDIGAEDCLTYVGGLSGSTWAFAVWEGLNLSTNELATNVKNKFEHGHMIVPTAPVFPELKNIVLSKILYDHSKVSTITDVYAAQLSVHLFRDSNPPASKLSFTDIITNCNLNEGLYPMPIFVSAIQEPNSEYEWFEFTPYTVGCSAYDCFIPTSLFGRKFTNGKLKYPDEEPHEICLAYLLATFGTAFCAPWRRVADEFFEKMEVQPISLLSENLFECRGSFAELLMRLKLSDNHAIEPPLFRNFMYGTSRSPVRKLRYFPLVDAGIDFNLPFPPLLDPLREVDIIIAANSSRAPDIAENYSLISMEKYAKRKNLKFPTIDYEKEQEHGLIYERPWSVFCDKEDTECPIIIYLPLSKNPEYKEDFDPQENARVGGYCGTFNFDINPEQFDELTGLTRFNANQIKEALKSAIQMKIKQRKDNHANLNDVSLKMDNDTLNEESIEI